MFCSSGADSLAAAEARPPPPLVRDLAANGRELRPPVSIPVGFHVYANGNRDLDPDPDSPASPPEEDFVNPQNPSPNPQTRAVSYRECQRNHAANIGGHAVDGCGEFMAAEEDLLKCAACGCHRNFHRREAEGEESPPPCEFCALRRKRRYGGAAAAASSAPGSPIVPYYTPPLPHGPMAAPHMLADSDDPDNNGSFRHRGGNGMRKRFRTKFSQEQKEKMYFFAEKVGWRMQKQDEAAVQEFCSEIGVDKGVLKVWMHNNKHTLGKKP